MVIEGEVSKAAQNVADVIADEAAEIVAERNEETSQGEAINKALIDAQLSEIHGRRLTEIEDRFSVASNALLERIAGCETQITMALARAEALETQTREMLLTLALLSPPPLLAEEGVPEKTEPPVPPPVEPGEAEPAPEPPAVEKKKSKRRLI